MQPSSRDKRRGFTVIETLALVTLLGFATVAVFPQFASYRERSRSNVAKHHIAQLNELVERHFVDVGVWPADLAELVTNGYLAAIPDHPDLSKRYQLQANHRVEEVSGSGSN